jgi:gamma-glutamyltranspeptidase/glutathione hydrolase
MANNDAMVVAPQPEAVEAGVDILKAGGNAVDAAIASALVQEVIDPLMCGIAGFGSMAVYLPETGMHEYIDFHAPAPLGARPDMWADLVEGEARDGYGFFVKDNLNLIGYQSACVPASLKAFWVAHQRHGRLPWSELFSPAIHWARNGWTVRPHVAAMFHLEELVGCLPPTAAYLAYSESGRKLYCRNDGTPKRIGDRVINGDLANVLEIISSKGADEFYEGEIAEQIVTDMREHGGLISRDDLKSFRPRINPPLWGDYRGYRVSTNSPPGGGIMLIEMLNILENFDLGSLGHNSAEYIKVVSEAMRFATIDKDRYVGDPAFIDVPIERLSSKSYARELAERIMRDERAEVPRLNSGFPRKDTTHVSILDKDGGCVSLTHSLGVPSGVITSGLGFMYNGCMSIFDPRPGNPGSIAPGKARFSSICPSILFKGDEPYLVIGAPGATQIAMGVLQVVLNVLDFGMSMSDAVMGARFSATSTPLDVSNRIPHAVTRVLESQGYEVIRSPLSHTFAFVHGIRVREGRADGGADPGTDGMAMLANARLP